MPKKISRIFALMALCLGISAGCGGDGGGDDSGSLQASGNDANLVACMGDSITQGLYCDGAPYPSRLASMSGKTVLNYGVGGATSAYGVNIVGSVLSRKPGYVCILYGSNDAIRGRDAGTVKENLRQIIVACKNNGSIPIIATPPPQVGEHTSFNGAASRIAEEIRALASEEDVRLVDLNKSFGSGDGLLNTDGLHMTDAGSQHIAEKFNSKM